MAIVYKLLDYKGDVEYGSFDVDIENVALAWVTVYTGDEEITLITKTGERFFDSMYDAFQMYFDDEYDIIKNGEWVVDREEWEKRKGSYWNISKVCDK